MVSFDRTPAREELHDDPVAEPATAEVEQQSVVQTVAVPGIATVQRELDVATDPLGGTAADPSVVRALQRRAGQGEALEGAVADRFGTELGADLSAVRIHRDPEAAELAEAVQATAFTYGTDIYFAPGAYAPGSPQGQQRLAHELAHVVQQGGSSPTGQVTIGRADDRAETDAENIAAQVLQRLRSAADPTSGVTAPMSADLTGPSTVRRFRLTAKPGAAPTDDADADAEFEETEESDEEAAEALPLLVQFAEHVETAEEPADEVEAEQRLATLEAMVQPMSGADRIRLWMADEVMTNAESFVGRLRYLRLVKAVAATPGEQPAPEAGEVEEETGEGGETEPTAETEEVEETEETEEGEETAAGQGHQVDVDLLIRHSLGAGNLAGYLAAGEAGGTVVSVDDDTWQRLSFYLDIEQPGPAGEGELAAPAKPAAAPSAEKPDAAIATAMRRYRNMGAFEYGLAMADALTEYFTRKVTDHPEIKISREANQDNLDWLSEAFMPLLGGDRGSQEQVLADAFFAGQMDPLKAAFVNHRAAMGDDDPEAAWYQLISDMYRGYWGDAETACW